MGVITDKGVESVAVAPLRAAPTRACTPTAHRCFLASHWVARRMKHTACSDLDSQRARSGLTQPLKTRMGLTGLVMGVAGALALAQRADARNNLSRFVW